MGFWNVAGELAKEIGKDYYREKGIEGTVQDVLGIASGIKNFFSSNDSSDNEFNIFDLYNQYMNSDQYDQAVMYVDNCYRSNNVPFDY